MIDIETELIFEQAPTQGGIQKMYETSERIFGRAKSFFELTKVVEDERKYMLVLKIKE